MTECVSTSSYITLSYNTATLNNIWGTAIARRLRSLSLLIFSSRQRARANTARARPEPPLPLFLAPADCEYGYE